MDARRRFLQREVDEVREGASVTRGGGERRRFFEEMAREKGSRGKI